MKKNKYNWNFHQTFFPDIEYVARILEACESINEKSKEEISDLTGIPTGVRSGKVQPHIEYAKFMGLIEYDKKSGFYSINRTALGEKILEEDLYFQEEITKLVCNYYLTSKLSGAKMWFDIVRKFPEYIGTSMGQDIILNELIKTNDLKTEPKLTAFRGTYSKLGSLGELKLLVIDESENKRINYKFIPHKIKEEYVYMYGYTLVNELRAIDPLRIEFIFDEIIEEIYWNRGFNWDRDMAYRAIELLESYSILKINRQLSPITVILNSTEGELLDALYSTLI